MGFSPDWLDLRATADARARNSAVQAALVTAVGGRGASRLRVLDLGSGTGANLAALSSVLPCAQDWLLVDNDPDLLARVAAPRGLDIATRVADLSTELEALFDPAPDLVTASAFFDLSGAALVERLVRCTASAGAVFHTVLTYDGREIWEPAHPLDAEVLAAFHADQQSDKGLGPALGPAATDALRAGFEAVGYRVQVGASDWVLEQPADAALIRALAQGSGQAVCNKIGGATEWAAARSTADRVVIGHQDLLAVPLGA